MTVDKHSQDALAKLYAEWVSAGVKLSVAGFAASTKIMEAATQSVLAARAKANESIRARESATAAPDKAAAEFAGVAETKPVETKPVKVSPVKPVKPAQRPEAASRPPVASAVAEEVPAAKAGTSASLSADDLKLISGIGPKLEQMLKRRGLSIAAIAALSDEDAARLDAELGLDGRIARDDWVAQAKKLAGA